MQTKKIYENTLSKFIEILNNILPYFEDEIKKNTTAFKYKSKIFTKDLLLYRMKYVEKDATFARVLSNINNKKLIEKQKIFKLNTISAKDNKVPSLVYKNLHDRLFTELNELFNFDNKIIVIDGTYSNTNIKHDGTVETSMSLVFYDPINNLDLDINFTGGDKKNNEKIKLQEYISSNLDKFKGKTIIMDRAYHCYDFFKFLINNDINFIIRLKDKDANTKNKTLKEIEKDVKIYKNNFENTKIIYDKDKKNSKIIKTETVKLATNIKKLSEKKIYELYGKRWSVEENIKQLKHNFKFQVLKEYKEDKYDKIFYCNLIEMLIKCGLNKIFYLKKKIKNTKNGENNKSNNTAKKNKKNKENKKNSENKEDEKKEKIIKLNENLILAGIKDILISEIIEKNINSTNIENFFITNYVEYSNEINRSNPRVSKIPFSKWYVKKYLELYKEIIKENKKELKEIETKNKDDEKIIEIKKNILKLKKEKKDILEKIDKKNKKTDENAL